MRLYIHESKWQTKLIEAGEERAAIHLNSLYSQARTFELLHQPTTILSFTEHCDRLIASGEDVTVQSELEGEREGVTLITAHSSKGLEFPVVFVVNMVMRRFPLQMNGSDLRLPVELVTPLKDIVPQTLKLRLSSPNRLRLPMRPQSQIHHYVTLHSLHLSRHLSLGHWHSQRI